MIAIFGQGKVGVPLQKLLRHFGIEAKSIDYHCWDEELFTEADQIIVHQAVKPDSDIYVKYGDKTISELNFIGQLLEQQTRKDNISFIGVTGTDGKSTTCHVLYQLLKGLLPDYHIWLSGNFDESIATTLGHILDENLTDHKHLIVTELSSFLLYGLKNMQFDYSIRTNLSPDHLNRHPDMKDYVATKYELIKHTTKHAFVTQGVMDTLKEYKIPLAHTVPVTIYAGDYPLANTQFLGKHNAENLQADYLLTKQFLKDRALSVSDDVIHATMNNIKPLDHRIQLIAQKDGIKFYDDSKATSSQALKVALEAFSKPIVLIAGGSDKGDSFDKLGGLMKEKLAYGVFIGTTGPQLSEIAKKKKIPYNTAETMEEAVQKAYGYAKISNIDVVLLSPGCASFDMFKDYLDRAHKFKDAVKALS